MNDGRRIPLIFMVLAAGILLVTGCAPQKPLVTSSTELAPPESRPSQVEAEELLPAGEDASAAGQIEQPGRAAEPGRFQPDFASSRQRLENRLSHYEEKLALWQELDERIRGLDLIDKRPSRWYECLTALEEVVLSYRGNGEQFQEMAPIAAGDLPPFFDRIWLDVAFLESDCGSVYREAAAMALGRLADVTMQAAFQMEQAVMNHARQGRDAEAIQTYENLITAYPEFSASPATRHRYGLALVRVGRSADAIAFIRQSLEADQSQRFNLPLKRLLADLLLVQGELSEAKELYGQLAEYFDSFEEARNWVDEQLTLLTGLEGGELEMLTLFQDLLERYLAFDGRKVPAEMKFLVERIEENSPGSQVAARARQILWLAEEQTGAWVGGQLRLVDSLVEEKEFPQAFEIIEKLLEEELADDVRRIVQDALDQVIIAENEEKQAQALLLEQAQVMQWEKANKLLGMEQYDEAVAAYRELIGTSYDEQAKNRIMAAANSAAVQLRRDAAGLFVKAKKSGDPEKKKQLMLESLALLQQILTKYAETDIIDKVRLNIQVLEEQIRLLDLDMGMPSVPADDIDHLRGTLPGEGGAMDSPFGE